MLKKENRITRNKDFDRVFKTGQSFYGKILGMKVLQNDLEISRFGILLGLKVSKKAVIRNRFKRQLREIIREELPIIKSGQDIVLIVFPLILDKNFEEIREYFKNGLKRLNLYK